MADGTNNAQMNDSTYRSSAYIIPTEVFTSIDTKLIYTPKKWEDNELLERLELNNLEQGIQIALEQTSTIQQTSQTAIDNLTNYYTNTVLPSLQQFSQTMENLPTTISTQVDNSLATNNSNIIQTLSNLLGTNYVATTDTLPVELKNGMSTVDARLVSLYNAIFDNNANKIDDLNSFVRGANNSNSLNNKVTALQNELGGGNGQASFKDRIEAAMGRSIDLENNETADAQTGEYSNSLKKLIENLQTNLNSLETDLGLGNNQSGQLSLIDKIEGMVGRSLDLANNETIDQQTGEYSNSIMTAINQIKGVLGIEGGVSGGGESNLVDDVNTLLDLMYGYTLTTVDSITTKTRNQKPNLLTQSLANNYLTLYNNFYNATISYNEPILDEHGKPVLDENDNPTYNTITQTGSLATLISNVYNRIGNVDSANNYLIDLLSDYEDLVTKAENSYEAAETSVYGEDTYLILKRNKQASIAESAEDFSETGEYNNSTYIQLPKGGGGGGAIYTNIARFTDVTYPTNTSLVIGDTCNITFTWSVFNEEGTIIPLTGNLTIRLNGSSVYSTVIDSGVSITRNLGQYINTSGRNNFTITVTNETITTRTLYVTVTAYQATLTSSFNENKLQTNSSIEYSYLASIGSNIITKVLHIEIDGTPLTLSSNETLTEIQNSVVFTTPSAGSHLMKVWFSAQVSETVTITSNPIYYGIICGISPSTVIATNFINGTIIERYNTLIIHYLVVTPNQETTRVEFYINNSEIPIKTSDVAPTYQDWSYTVTNGTGPLTIKIKANGVEKILTATVIDENHYDLSMVTTGLKLYLTADQRSNTGLNLNVWTNSAGAVISNIYQEQIDQIDPDEQGISEEEKLARQARITELQTTLTNTLSLIPSVTTNMENFLFYKTVDGWQQDSDGAYFLRLRNQNKVTIPFPVFTNDIAETGATFEIDFKTKDVADYDARIVQCYEGNSFANSTKNILLTAQNATLNNIKGLTTQYKEEEKITLTFVINASRPEENSQRAATKTDGLLYIYINGILSAATPYQEAGTNAPDLGFTAADTAKIVLGSSDCTLDIYSIKYYNRALTYKEIIKNWVFNTGNFDEKIDRFMRNNYTTVSIAQFIQNSRNTPYMIITGEGPLDGENAFMPQKKGSEFKKIVNVEYVDPINPEYSFTANSRNVVDFTGKAEVQVQGTSSQAYFRKNYKIKLSSFTQNNVFHIKSPADEYYDIVYETVTDDVTGETSQVEVSRALKENVTKDGYKLSANSYPEFTFCIKADVASSESVNNTGLTMIYDEVSRKFMTTPPQYDDDRIRQGVEGYPMVTWYRDSVNNTETLLGKYNFNNDKGTAKVYGLKSNLDLDKTIDQRSFAIENGIYDESWEVKNNDADSLVMFEVPGTAGSAERNAAWLGYTYADNKVKVDSKNSNAVLKWQDSFESRFPDQDDEGIALINPNASTTSGEINVEQSSQTEIAYLNKRLAGLREMVEWVNDTVEWAPTFNNTNWELIEEPSTTDQNEAIEWQMNGVYNLNDKVNFENSIYKSLVNNNILGTNKTRITSASASNFKAGFENYFNLNALLFFYNFTELFLMVDSRAKNMFWTRYQVRNGKRPKTAGYDQDVNTLAPDNFNYFGWFTFPYDFDTALGINNQGKNVYDYHWESLDVTGPGGSAIFGGQYSKLWVAFRQVYANEIASMYQRMSADINYNKVESLFERNQSIWSETIVNEDMIVKYINWAADIGYDMLLGLKDMQRKWWLWNRFKYFNSKYAIERGTDNINIRVHVNNANIPVQVYADSYVSLNVGANGTPTTIRVLRGQTGTLIGGSAENTGSTDSSGIETYISPASALKSVQNLSTLRISSIDVSKAIRLQELQIGTPNYQQRNELLRSASVAPAEGYSSLLRSIDFRNCTNLGKLDDNTPTPTLNVSGCLFLNKIYLAGTPLHVVNLPNGGVLKTIQYPTTIKTIKIENQPFLENLIIGAYLPINEITDDEHEVSTENHVNDYSAINVLYLDNVGIIDEENHTNSINSAEIINQMSTGKALYLNNFVWNMTAEEFINLYDKIITMHGFTEGIEDNEAKPHLNGSVYVTGELSEDFINHINDNIDGIINIYTIINGEVHAYYSVSFYGLGNELLLTRIVPGYIADPSNTLFTEEYLTNYNTNYNPGWVDGISATRIGFGGWKEIKSGTYNLSNITSNIELHADKVTQSRMDYYMLDENPNVDPHKIHKYYNIGEQITSYYNNEETFVRDYYKYIHNYWTTTGTNYKTTAPNVTEGRSDVTLETHIKSAEVESLYDVYRRELATYNVYIYNTFIDDAREPILIGQFSGKTVLPSLSNANSNTISYNELAEWNPTIHSEIAIFDPNQNGDTPFYANDINKADSARKFRFLGWRPNITTTNPIKVTGDMHIQLVYYCVDDIFTRYFLNNIDDLTLPNDITTIPDGGFLHSSNLRMLHTKANLIKTFSFCNQAATDSAHMKYYIFTNQNDDIYLQDYCFYGLRNANIIFYTHGTVYVSAYAFAEMYNCNILMPYSPTLIKVDNTLNYYEQSTALSSSFTNFFSSQDINHIYVSGTAFNANTYQQGIPSNLLDNNFNNSINTDHIHIGALQTGENLEIVNTILEGAGINDIQFTV